MTPEAFEGDVARLRERFVDAFARDSLTNNSEQAIAAATALVAALEAGAEPLCKCGHEKDRHPSVRCKECQCEGYAPARQEPPPPVPEERPAPCPRCRGQRTSEKKAPWSRTIEKCPGCGHEQELWEFHKDKPWPTPEPLRQEPKRGRGVEERIEALLLAMCRPDYEIVKMCVNHWHPDLQEIRAAYRAERAEAEAQRQENSAHACKREGKLRALQSTHEALRAAHQNLVKDLTADVGHALRLCGQAKWHDAQHELDLILGRLRSEGTEGGGG